MYLYKVTTTGNFEAYVIAENPDEAYETFRIWLEEKNYGYYSDRYLRSVECIAEQGRMCDQYKTLLMAPDAKNS